MMKAVEFEICTMNKMLIYDENHTMLFFGLFAVKFHKLSIFTYVGHFFDSLLLVHGWNIQFTIYLEDTPNRFHFLSNSSWESILKLSFGML